MEMRHGAHEKVLSANERNRLAISLAGGAVRDRGCPGAPIGPKDRTGRNVEVAAGARSVGVDRIAAARVASSLFVVLATPSWLISRSSARFLDRPAWPNLQALVLANMTMHFL
jgi:hypothetical protein